MMCKTPHFETNFSSNFPCFLHLTVIQTILSIYSDPKNQKIYIVFLVLPLVLYRTQNFLHTSTLLCNKQMKKFISENIRIFLLKRWKTKNLFSIQLMYFFFILKLKSKFTLLNVCEIKDKHCFQMKNFSHPIYNSSQSFKVDRKVILFLFYREEN